MSNLGHDFYTKLVEMSARIGMKPEDLLVVMVSESGLNPAIQNNIQATGLIQFIPSTLKGVGFKGSPNDFANLSGEQQLVYIEKYIKSLGHTFKSAAQYYVGNMFPAALDLPGVSAQDPKAIILEENPQPAPNPKNPLNPLSKKFVDIGNHNVSVNFERKSFQGNRALSHGKNFITFGDFQEWVNSKKNDPRYLNALSQMKNQTGYQPSVSEKETMSQKDELDEYLESLKDHDIKEKTPSTSPTITPDTFSGVLDTYIKSSELAYKKIYKNILPQNNFVINIKSSDYVDGIEFARILTSALDEELLSTSNVHTDGNNVDVECSVAGPIDSCFNAVEGIVDGIKESFTIATKKIGSPSVNTSISMNKKSFYKPISWKLADANYRKFLLKFI